MAAVSETHVNPSFEFIGFEPTDSLMDKAIEKFERVFSESPSDASNHGFVRKTISGFEGRFQIRSAVGIFAADVSGEDPMKVIEDLSRNMRTQLRLWKRQRFH